jgi:hypothetical protein
MTIRVDLDNLRHRMFAKVTEPYVNFVQFVRVFISTRICRDIISDRSMFVKLRLWVVLTGAGSRRIDAANLPSQSLLFIQVNYLDPIANCYNQRIYRSQTS